MLIKLEAYGITGKVLAWLRDFLIGRRQRAVLNGCSSSWSSVLNGVPQGSVLGPLLFNIYVNNMPNCVNSPILQFADDVKMFQAIGGAADFQQLQADITFVDWSIKWQLRFNVSKYNLLHLRPLYSLGSSYNINGVVVSPSNLVKDLGVLIDNKFKFHNHSSVTASKANRMLAIISKSFQYMDGNILLNLRIQIIFRPIVEYGTTIWGPYYVLDQQLIERIQRRAMKSIYGLHDQPYVDRLARLHLPSLQYCRLRGYLNLLYHMYHNNLGINFTDYFITSHVTFTRGHSCKCFKPHAISQVRSNFFSVRIIDFWNSLPNFIIQLLLLLFLKTCSITVVLI